MKAINGWVFVRRDKTEETFEGMEISEGARVRNQMGTVAFVEDGLCVGVGDRVHLPHYETQVMNIEHGGVEYAVVKVGSLFAKEHDGVFVPLNRYVKCLKCVNDHERNDDGSVLLYMTDKHLEKTNFVEILGIADDCKHVGADRIGELFVSPESDDRVNRLLYSKEYMIHEDLLPFTVEG